MQRKTNKTRGPNTAEKAFHAWIKEQPCVISGRVGVELHHMYGSTFTHNKILIGHWAVLPLHYDYHRGEFGIHTIGKKAWCEKFDTQYHYWRSVFDKFESLMKKKYRPKRPCGGGGMPTKIIPDEVWFAIEDWGR